MVLSRVAAYIQHDDYNVIVVDWGKISVRPYVWASLRVKMVGRFVSSMIDFLVKHGLDLSRTTFVGHSLGAHVVGVSARFVNGTVKYIVGESPREQAIRMSPIADPCSR